LAVREVAAGSPRPRLTAISGQVCSPFDPPPGCAFAPRCPLHGAECDIAMPPLAALGDDRQARCIRVEEESLA